MQKPLSFYVDGTFVSQTGIGGYAIIPINDNGKVQRDKVVRVGTYAPGCLAMELRAVIAAMRQAPTNRAVTIYSDCLTVVDVAARGDIKRMGALREDWETLLALVKEKTNISIAWVRGHADDKFNHEADRAAKQAARQFTDMIKIWASNVPAKALAENEIMACVA